ncbi:MAG: sensor histidine kinase [Acidimicrobiales bacterium]
MHGYDSYREHLQSMFTVPATEAPPRRVWRDWVLFAAVLVSATSEVIWRADVIWRWGAFVVCITCAIGILYRRIYPLVAAVIPFAVFNIAEVTSLIVNDGASVGLYTSAFVLVLVYAVFRWSGGPQMVTMSVVMAVAWVIGWFGADVTLGDIIGAAIVLSFPAVAGLEVRHARHNQRRSIDEARSREREQIARELHDSVAHHVSAIAIQAQAGLAVSEHDPQAARAALEVVEEAAARTLSEMRTMVGALRDDNAGADLAPQAGVRDIERLGETALDAPDVHVELHGDLGDLSPPVDAALFRLAQESITNANRHARNATHIRVCVDGSDKSVRLQVTDDGDTVSTHSVGTPGYGLLGMAERTKLLGGQFRAGPGSGRGWTVNVELPRVVPSS